jgi:hypothetical protein
MHCTVDSHDVDVQTILTSLTFSVRSLSSILYYPDDDVADVFGLSFSISKDSYGTMQEVDLVPNGANIMVNKDNKYVKNQ